MKCAHGSLLGLLVILAGGPVSAKDADAATTTRPATQPAGPNHLDTTKRISFNFQGADIDEVLAYLSKVAGVTFLKETAVSGEVTIVNQQDLTVADAFDVLNGVLKAKGATCIVNETRLVKIVSLSEAKRADTPIITDSRDLPRGETVVTHVVPLKRARARDLAREIRNLVGTFGDLAPLSHGNALAITDTANNVRRLLAIIKQADTVPLAAAGDLRVFLLKHANAKQVADIITKLFAEQARSSSRSPTVVTFRRFRGRRSGSSDSGDSTAGSDEEGAPIPVRVTVDERLNAVIVTAGADQMAIIEKVIEQVDTRAPDIARLLCEVIFLKHGDCNEVAKVLKEVFKQSTGSSRGQAAPSSGVPESLWRRFRRGRGGSTQEEEESGPASGEELKVTVNVRTNALVLVGTRDQIELARLICDKLDTPGEKMDMMLIRLKNAKAAELERALRQMFREANQAANRLDTSSGSTRTRSQTAVQQTAAPGIAGETVVVANEETNSLMIVSNPKNFPRIEQFIRDLDSIKPQVFIQALIGEITLDEDTELGINFEHVDEPFRHGSGTATWTMDFGITPDLRGGTVAISYRDIELVIRALQTEGKLNVLSRPHILTLDNQTATITDGERVPFIQNTRATEEGTIFNTVKYEDIGIILEVTPQINPDGWVNMVVKQEISRVTGRTVPISESVDAPTFATRSAETTVSIRDRQTIVIGGLIAESEVETIEKIPLLGDLPLIGIVFQRASITTQRKELLLILTPYVVRSDQELEAVSERRRGVSEFKRVPADPADRTFRGRRPTSEPKPDAGDSSGDTMRNGVPDAGP